MNEADKINDHAPAIIAEMHGMVGELTPHHLDGKITYTGEHREDGFDLTAEAPWGGLTITCSLRVERSRPATPGNRNGS